jgi:hypothetical protein
MKAILALELRGDNARQLTRLWSSISDMNLGEGAGRAIFGSMPPAAWCAEITGRDPKFKYKRDFLRYKKDYSQANSKGSRGVRAIYMLDEGKVYDVKDWKERYFCAVKDWEIHRIDESEVEEWLNARSGSTS